MEDAKWQILRAAFAEGGALSGVAREAFLAAFRNDHPALADELEQLLASEAGETYLRDAVAAGAADVASEPGDDIWLGRALGSWRIVERIAGGGMGAVFLAERADSEYAQRAAIKVMATQLLAPEAVARFKAERQILANLKHPFIAALLDGGATDDGLPYLVMEFIDGLPIDDYCRRHALTIDARLDLFRKVSEAVDFAHRNLVVHRDLKPGNILVDQNGNPKLLDFGIAKLIEPREFQQTVAETRPGVLAMTPEYASPEQVRGEPVSVASDVYALGVLLFKLLTGQSPYVADPTTPGSYQRAILENEPRKPSTAITATFSDAEQRRGFSEQAFRGALIGDLDNIVLRALQKDPERRYRNVADFARDIERHQNHEPIEARADEWWYRAGKFLRRHATRVVVTTLVLLGAIAVVTFYTLRLAAERDRANLEAAQSAEVAEYLTSLFEGASPNIQAGNVVTAVDLLEEGGARIDELEGQPELQARLMQIMAGSSTALGREDVAIAMLLRAVEIQESMTPVDEVALSRTTHTLAEAYRQNGQYAQAAEFERRTIELATRHFGEGHYNVAYLKMRLGVMLLDLGETEEALRIKQESLAQLIKIGSGESTAALDARGNIAVALARLGRYEEAAEMSGEVARLSPAVQGERHPNTIIRTTNYANYLERTGHPEKARDLLDDNIPLGISVWQRDHYHIPHMHHIRGNAYREIGDFAASIRDHQEAISIAADIWPDDDYRRGTAWHSLGTAFVASGRLDEAADAFDKALANASVAEGGARRIPTIRYWLGLIAYRRGDLETADARYSEAAEEIDVMRGIAPLMLKTARVLLWMDRKAYDQAQPYVEEIVALDDGFAHLPAFAAATAFYRETGEFEMSLQVGERINSIIEATGEPLSWRSALALGEYGLTLAACGRAEAQDVLESVASGATSALDINDARVVRFLDPRAPDDSSVSAGCKE